MTQRGFTLFEVMIAVGIFAVVGVAANQLLRQVMTSNQIAKEHGDRLAAVQRAMWIIERDSGQIVARPIRDELGDLRAPLLGGAETMVEFTRVGWRNPLGQQRSELMRVSYELIDGNLIRAYWPVLDRAEDSQPIRQVLLTNVAAGGVDFINVEGEARSFWPDPNDADHVMPAAIRWRISAPPYGDLQRLVPLTAVAEVKKADADGQQAGTDTEQSPGPLEGDPAPQQDVQAQ